MRLHIFVWVKTPFKYFNQICMNKISTFLLWCFLLISISTQAALRVVVLGSSTSEGAGATAGNSWVNKYRTYLKGLNSENEVINLAKGGYTSYHIMATGNVAPGKQNPDVDRNITKALSLAPDVIIINMPTNDAAYDYTVAETMANFAAVIALATAENVPVYISTSQGRNFPWPANPAVSDAKRALLIELTAQINAAYGTKALDFWSTITNTDGTINSLYDSGDGIHLNDAGHDILYNRVKNTAAILLHVRTDEVTENINIDFGTLVDNSATSWNALTDFTTTGRINNLKNSDGGKSGIYVYVHDAFAGVNQNGAIQNSLGYPQRVSEDSFYGLSSNPTGGITLGGLSAGKKYRFKFYAGRMDVAATPPSRETKYVVTGQTSAETVLEATNNAGNQATIADVFADANGIVTITASAGASNATTDKYFYLGAVEIQATQYEAINSPGVNGIIWVDYGSPDHTTAGNWNNFTKPTEVGVRTNLINSIGSTTGYKMYIHDNFQDVNLSGTSSNPHYPANATKDSFYGQSTSPTGGVTLETLDISKKYSFKFFSSRVGAGTARETKITVTGNTAQTVYLDANDNVSNYVSVANMVPDVNGKITIDVTYGTNNSGNNFYYLGMVEINYETTTLPVKLLSFTAKKTMLGNQLEWKATNEINNKAFEVLRITDGNAQSIGSVDAKNAAHNVYGFTDRQPTFGNNYYQLKQIDNDGTSALSEVVVVKGEDLAFSASFSAEKLSVFASAEKGNGKLILSDISGRSVFAQNVTLQSGNNHYIFATQGLPSGVYVLTLIDKEGSRNIKVLKL